MKRHALIAGGGIGGLTAALCLAADGHRVDGFEQSADFSETGAGIQVSPNATRVLHALGLEAALKQHAFLPEATQFRQWRTGRVITQSPLGADARQKFGMPYYHMHRADLLKVLLDAATSEPLISLKNASRVVSFEQTSPGVRLLLDGGTEISGDFLVGADGIHSMVRTELSYRTLCKSRIAVASPYTI